MSAHRCGVCGSIVPPSAVTCRVCGTPAAAGLVGAVLSEPAPVRRRVAAALVDQIPVALLLALAVILLIGGGGWWPAIALGAAVAWLALLWVWSATSGSSPGKRWLRLVVVTAPDGDLPDALAALLRLMLRGGLCLVTAGVAGFSYRWDPDGRERTWWDRVSGTRVINASDGARDRSSAAVLAARWAPGAGEQPGSAAWPLATSSASTGLSAAPTGEGAAVPFVAAAPRVLLPTAGSELTVPVTAVQGGAWAPPPAVGAGPVGSLPVGSASVGAAPVGSAPVVSAPVGSAPVGPVPVGSAAQRFAPPPAPASARGPKPSDRADFLSRSLVGDAFHAVPSTTQPGPATGSAAGAEVPEGGSSAGAASDPRQAGMITNVPTAPMARPAVPFGGPSPTVPVGVPPITVEVGPDIPVGAPSSAGKTPSSAVAAAGSPAVSDISPPSDTPLSVDTAEFVWDGGHSVSVSGRVLIGRDPVPRPGESAAHLLSVPPGSTGVSKTHLQIDVDVVSGEVSVTDRRSTNGVRVTRPDGTVERCSPGIPVAVRVGDVVHFGGRSLTRSH